MNVFFKVKEKFFKIPLGADETNFYCRQREASGNDSDKLKLLFYGKFIPLQGISYILEAAKLLEKDKEIEFEIIGSGQLSTKIRNLATRLNIQNVTFIDWVNYRKLPDHIQEADICLGIFGATHKAQRGIPIKVYEALAMKKPVITGDSPATREVFQDRVNSILCEMANAKALAESILLLKEDKKLRAEIAETGFKLYQDLFSCSRIASEFKMALERCLDEKMDDIFISIIIPAYEARSTIIKTLTSLHRQDCEGKWEIVVVNSSQDETKDVIHHKFPAVTVIQLEKRVVT